MANFAISVIVPVYNGSAVLRDCLRAIFASSYEDYECIVVDDGSSDESASIASEFAVKMMRLNGGPHGPAYARNRGSAAARGEIIVFLDADVAIQPDTLSNIADTFAVNPGVDAVFGSYDNSPAAGDFVSQYKNLLHHFVHQQSREEGGTFWSGCGAIRREAFVALNGFDESRYSRPSIEDIDLGYRLRAAGRRVLLNKDLQAKHLKRWSLRRMVESDVFDRAIPWTLLIFRNRNLPNDLNLHVSQRLSALLVYLALIDVCLTTLLDGVGTAMLLPLAGLVLLVVGYWRWPDARAPVISKPAELATGLLLVVTVAIAMSAGHWNVIPLFAPLGVAMLVGHGVLRVARLRGAGFFATVLLGLLAAGALELGQHPSLLVAPLPISLSLVIVLNRHLYAFFARQGGLLFALTVIPLHLLYLAYSVLAFAVGAGIYSWRTVRRSEPGYAPAVATIVPGGPQASIVDYGAHLG